MLDSAAISALISEASDGENFVNYYIKKNPSISKDGAKEFQVIIESWSTNYTKSIAIADQVEQALEASAHNYTYLTADSEPVIVEQKIYIVTKQIFNINQ